MMAATATLGLGKMVHETDPRDDILKAVGMKRTDKGIPGFELLKNDVIVGIYTRPEKTAGGIIITQKTQQEDQYQGKAALVLMKGPTAFVSDKHYQFMPEQNVDVGDWVALWVTEGRKIKINGQLCRIIRDIDLLMKIPAPDAVY
jgi:co-chaperonin GroES (HSP10)